MIRHLQARIDSSLSQQTWGSPGPGANQNTWADQSLTPYRGDNIPAPVAPTWGSPVPGAADMSDSFTGMTTSTSGHVDGNDAIFHSSPPDAATSRRTSNEPSAHHHHTNTSLNHEYITSTMLGRHFPSSNNSTHTNSNSSASYSHYHRGSPGRVRRTQNSPTQETGASSREGGFFTEGRQEEENVTRGTRNAGYDHDDGAREDRGRRWGDQGNKPVVVRRVKKVTFSMRDDVRHLSPQS